MRVQKGLYLVWMVGTALFLSGCASSVFPDFDEGSEVVIDDGGKVNVRQVKENGILVADKENAAYEDEEDYVDEADAEEASDEVFVAEADEVEPAKVEAVEKAEIEPLETTEEEVVTAEAEEIPAEKETEPEKVMPSMHYLAATVYFENGGAVVDASYRNSLKKIAKLVKENDAVVTVYGFASSRTRDTDPASHKLANFKVSADRAQNTAKALRRAGVPADKITTQALSDSMPMYQEVMPEGERLNRRAEIYLTY